MARSMPEQKPGRSKQNYGTPRVFLTAVEKFLGIIGFDLDLAAERSNYVAPYYFNLEIDALRQKWAATLREIKCPDQRPAWAWLNPPFANIGKWAEKCWKESRKGAHIALLVPAGVGSNWWRDWVHEKAQVILLNGRITFDGTLVNPKTGKRDPYPKDCALIIYGPKVKPGYDVWSWAR